MYKKVLLLIIIILAFALRFYKLGDVPPSLYWDEVALGYNAYSIAETGYDEEGPKAFIENPTQFFGVGPIRIPVYMYLRSFGDFKPPVYIYAEVPMIKLFGLSEWTTRFPSAFFGALSIPLTYLITKKLFTRMCKKDEFTFSENTSEWTALIASLLLALAPWHTQLSRVAYEANVALFLVMLGVWFFLKSLDQPLHFDTDSMQNFTDKKLQRLESMRTLNRTMLLTLSGLSFVLTLYTFNSNRVFTPLLVALLGLLYWKEIIGEKWRYAASTVVAILISLAIFLPLYPHLTSHEAQLRYKEVNIFTDSKPVEIANERIARLGNTWWANILDNRRLAYTQSWLDGYFQHFTGRFLFISGDVNPRFSLQDVGELYLIELPFLLIGLYLFVSQHKKEQLTILGWLLLAPIPAAFAREVPHALRAENMLPTFQILAGYGFIYTLNALYRRNNKISFLLLAIGSAAFLTLNVIYYLHNYYVHYPKYAQSEWQYGYKQMIQEVVKLQDHYDRIIITDALGRPYINTLFYQNYPPSKFQVERQAKTDDTGFGFIDVTAFGKYQFKGINWKQDIAHQGTYEKVLLVGVPQEMKENQFTKAIIRNLKGDPVFILNEAPKGHEALLELK
jgi:4-amino-4-deoxy-L-arabinose transferase-like glycosyltransferase